MSIIPSSNISRSPSPSDSEDDDDSGVVQYREPSEAALEGFRLFCNTRKPMTQLSRALTVDYELVNDPYYNGPDKLSFGFGVTSDTLIQYALERRLVDPRKLTKGDPKFIGWERFRAINAVVKHLECITGAPRLYIRFPTSPDYEYMISLYDNYSKRVDEMDEQDEKEVLEILRKELNIPDDVPAMWWFEMEGY
ncbi:uncharacterized protein STEHIDRAFT_159664 [Stereum hirsutum FP-91666 SS1]|uniref:uncharacterized protein n=1 Tax=Stereum hirsutum (strain FP-91666) TaxID=721885 RepID=UPI00044497F2|nr:uncharacterized protein STEHIDRAFT_159664 [Stereum hirsutum FP-91666 SS1]EIM84062.1 hypothetical protein STEHIDRAFT_159664 [Stereum hirsutum FP-91666 SS1]